MSMLPTAVENTEERIDALKAALVTALPNRLVDRGYTHFTIRADADLTRGVLNLVTTGEGNYATGRGMAGREGTTRISLIGHLLVGQNDTTETLEKAELAFVEQIKDFVRQPLPGMSMRLDQFEKSRLLEHPYGWFVAFVELGPPRANTN